MTAVASTIEPTWISVPTASLAHWERPDPSEHSPYYSRYIDKVPEGDLLAFARDQRTEVVALFSGLTPEQAEFSYAPGKWTLKEVLLHLIDTERVFSYRALSIARADPNPLPGFEQDDWIAPARCAERTVESLLREWVAVRHAYLALIAGLPQEATTRRGIASDNAISVRALAYIPPGHTSYHLELIQRDYGIRELRA